MDNQFQAFQNQVTEGFLVSGSWLQELDEVVQIKLYVRISLRHLLLVDQQDLVLGGFLFLSLSVVLHTSDLFWATCRHFSIILIIFGF
jgi:hypothetical protein